MSCVFYTALQASAAQAWLNVLKAGQTMTLDSYVLKTRNRKDYFLAIVSFYEVACMISSLLISIRWIRLIRECEMHRPTINASASGTISGMIFSVIIFTDDGWSQFIPHLHLHTLFYNSSLMKIIGF